MARLALRTARLAVIAAATILAGCADDSGTSAQANRDQTRINQIQLLGTHNSYHQKMPAELFTAEKAVMSKLGDSVEAFGNIDELNYGHQPLTDQLNAGIRTFELDVWADENGGLFKDPKAPSFLGVKGIPAPTGMDAPGFKVLHIVDVDYFSSCNTLVLCLKEIRDWSDQHPNHLPIVINMELKDEALPKPIDVTKVEKIGPSAMDALDAEIRSVLSEDRLITPDDVRGEAATLRDAVSTTGWPTLADARGKVLFFMDNSGQYRTDYLAGHPSLIGRVLFTSDGKGEPDGAVLKLNDPQDGTEIRSLVEQGYLIRTRADDAPGVATQSESAQRDTAFASGAQIISTDYPITGPAPDGYTASFGSGLQARCNPVVVAATCAGDLESSD